MSLTTISESKEFCDTFVKNGNKISFIYRRMLTPPPEAISYDLFIGRQYWRLKAGSSADSFRLKFEDKNRESKDTKLTEDYLMGTAIPGHSRRFDDSPSLFISVMTKLISVRFTRKVTISLFLETGLKHNLR